MTTREALDALSVAHDAAIEGRSYIEVLDDVPMWARPDRQLRASPRALMAVKFSVQLPGYIHHVVVDGTVEF